jgi:hypothetical protein
MDCTPTDNVFWSYNAVDRNVSYQVARKYDGIIGRSYKKIYIRIHNKYGKVIGRIFNRDKYRKERLCP